MRNKLIFNVGNNDSTYVVQPTINGKQVMCPIYDTWYQMLRRCYSSLQSFENPAYKGCTVDTEWLNSYMSFYTWYCAQDKLDGKYKLVLDKDLLVPSNKIYSANTCLLIPEELNLFLVCKMKGPKSNGLPIGVDYVKSKSKYRARLGIDGKSKTLGTFSTPEAARIKYIEAVISHLHVLISRYNNNVLTRAIENYIQCLKEKEFKTL